MGAGRVWRTVGVLRHQVSLMVWSGLVVVGDRGVGVGCGGVGWLGSWPWVAAPGGGGCRGVGLLFELLNSGREHLCSCVEWCVCLTSYEGHMVDALASRADEGRWSLR